MARVSTYANDSSVGGGDRLLGTDAGTGRNKNYPLTSIAGYLNNSGSINILGQLTYKFITSPPATNGSFYLSGFGGDGTSMSAVTQLIFSGYPAGDYNAGTYLTSLLGKRIIIGDYRNLANYAVFELTAIAETAPGSDYYSASLTYKSGDGVLNEDHIYGLVAEGLSAVWGSISGTISDQSDLAAYITSVVPDVPYETAQDIVDALNSFGNDGFVLSTIPQFGRGIEIGVDDTNNSVYSLPDGGLESEIPGITDKFGYFLLTNSEGNLYWKNFPLEFLGGLDEEAVVDGGTF